MRQDHGFHRDTDVATARAQWLELVEPLERTESSDLRSSRGRVLATDVAADRDVPHYDRAAMDGWAVHARDTEGASRRQPRELEIVEGHVGDGEATRVHTGSELPPGADAVVMVEDTTDRDGRLEVYETVAEGRHVGEAGEDIAAGETVLEAGDLVTPSAMALLRSLEIDSVEVFDAPDVAVIPTGEELVTTDPAPGEVIETNGLMVAEYVESWGATVRYGDIVPDDLPSLTAAIEAAAEADLVVTTGGSSVGERDRLPEAIESIGELVVHGVAIQPGHPVGLGRVGDTPLAMLPGYPVSCAVNAQVFVRPAVQALGHRPYRPRPALECELTEKITSRPGRRTVTRVHLDRTDDDWRATPAMTSGAGILSSMAQTDAVVVVPESLEGYDRGDRVTAVFWE